jgi:hypothetical protein
MELNSWKKVGSLFKNHNRESFKHGIEIRLIHGELDPVLEWCNVHCHGRWGWMDHTDLVKHYDDNWIFLFDDEKDFTLFLLRWF